MIQFGEAFLTSGAHWLSPDMTSQMEQPTQLGPANSDMF